MVKLHFLDLHESPFRGEDYGRFRMTWYLKDDGRPKNAPDDYGGISTGDLIAVDELFTGAGDLEGLRAVGPKSDGRFLLLGVGIEYIEWPKEILDWAKEQEESLKELYEEPLNRMLDESGFTIEDLVDDIDEFWDRPLDGGPHKAESNEEWEIPLSGCRWKPKLYAPGEQHPPKRTKVEEGTE